MNEHQRGSGIARAGQRAAAPDAGHHCLSWVLNFFALPLQSGREKQAFTAEAEETSCGFNSDIICIFHILILSF